MRISIKDHSITFNGLLTIIFVMLKLQRAIDWNWIWVLCPLWIPIALAAAIFIAFFLAYVAATIFGSSRGW